MTAEPLEETYFKWLAVQVVNHRPRNPRSTYWSILRQLHQTEFTWTVHNDDNRVEDGRELRSEFLESINYVTIPIPGWQTLGCSFLEMLIALSRRLSFQAEGEPSDWFWHLLDNVGLIVSDWDYEEQRMRGYVDQVLQSLNNRTYDRNGRGGLFPLHDSDVDQTQVELWYQMNYYLLERS